MTMTNELFSGLISLVHQEGVDQAIGAFPEVAQHREALIQLLQAEEERARLEELEASASTRVDHLEMEIHRLLEVEG